MSEYPRITYQASERAFDRLFKGTNFFGRSDLDRADSFVSDKEQSLEETKQIVRKKLGLSCDTPIQLAQLRGGKRIDLEDDDDFEAFKALTRTLLHATVEVTIPENILLLPNPHWESAPGEEERHSNDSLPEALPREVAESGATAPATRGVLVQLPGMHATGTSPPPKRRKMASNGNHVTLAASPPAEQSISDDVVSSLSRIAPPSAVQASTSGAIIPPLSKSTMPHPAPNAGKKKSSVRTETAKSGKPKRKAAKYVPSGDESAGPAETSRKKRKAMNGIPPRRESFPEHETPNLGDVNTPSDTRKKRLRKEKMAAPAIPTGDDAAYSGARTARDQGLQAKAATPATADSLRAGMAVTDVDMPQKGKGKKQKHGQANVLENNLGRSKTGLMDPDKDGIPDSTKASTGKALKKKVTPEVSRAGTGDDIDKTIAAFLSKKLQADGRTFSDLATASELAVPVHDSPLKRIRNKLKPYSETDGADHPTRVPPASSEESMETNGDEDNVARKVDQRLDATIDAVEEETAASPEPAPEPRFASAQSPESESDSKSGGSKQQPVRPACSAKSVHPLTDCPVFLEGADVIGARIAQMEVDKLRPSSEVIRIFAAKARSTSSGSSSGSSSTESPRVPVPGGPSTRARPTIPKDLEISEVHVEGHGEGSSDESSTEGEDEGAGAVPLAMRPVSVTAPSVPVHVLEDQLTALIRGPEKRGPRKSVLDEIPSSSETGSETSSEDLMLDEEEDLSQQPSRKLMKPPTINEAEDHASLDAEKAFEQAENDTETVQPHEARDQDHPGSLLTAPDKVGAMGTGMKTPKLASPESDATIINTEPTRSPIPASTEHSKGTILVPASSPNVAQAVANSGKEDQSEDEIDDVDPPDEPLDNYKESDPIEAELTQPAVNRPEPTRSIEPAPPESRGRAPPPVSKQPSRRSGRVANRLSSVNPTPSVKDDLEWTRDERVEASREKSKRNPVGKVGHKSLRPTTRRVRSTVGDASPSVTQEDDPVRPASSQAEWTTLAPPEPTQPDAPSVIDELRTSSQGPAEKLSPDEGESSASEVEEVTPMPTRRRAMVASQGKRGRTHPLFFPGSSQAHRARASPSASGSENESEKATSLLPKKTPTRSTLDGVPFRRLSQIASQDILFSKSKVAEQVFKNTPSVKVRPPFVANDDGKDDEESSTSSDDTAPESHIPKERRAGAATGKRRKGQGLSSLVG
ncbi:hypothetical protein BJV78DRAFT_1278655 [Lactifluus subvellereus]|nr:hypothetical protein BJV78DRAFT_1278655 [Lactifluus subvellereus]